MNNPMPMNSKNLSPPFDAYSGTEPYLFASYAHKDAPLVFPELAHLYKLGYRIWYDEGIDPGREWSEEVARALQGSVLFVVFISPAAVESRNVRDEINYALNHNKMFLAIHIQHTQLPPGLDLRMGDIQAILQYQMSADSYYRKIEKALPSSLMDNLTTIVDRKIKQICNAFERVLRFDEAWYTEPIFNWRSQKSSLISRCEINWDEVSPSGRKELAQVLWGRLENVHAWTEIEARIDFDDFARRIIDAYRILYPAEPLARLIVQSRPKPQFSLPWYTLDENADSGDDDATCKQCGYGEIYGGVVRIPLKCPRCGLG